MCYSSCDVVTWNPDYLGPAALNRAWTLVNDVRDVGQRERLAAVAGDAGCHACHTQMSCTERCPKQLSPTKSIAGLKRAVLARGAERRAVMTPQRRVKPAHARSCCGPRSAPRRASSRVCVLVHLATIIYAVRGGLTAAEILERTRGSVGWAVFYARVRRRGRGARADRTCAMCWPRRSAGAVAASISRCSSSALVLALWGWRAVYAVVAGA